MRTDELDFELPPELIAQRPAEPRDAARLLVLRGDREPEHRTVRELPELLAPTDALVFNTSAVIPARLIAHRATGRRVEGLALGPVGDDPAGLWRVLLRAGGRLRAGERLVLRAPQEGTASDGAAIVPVERDGQAWRVRFESTDGATVHAADGWSILARNGWTPLPPYILQARRAGASLQPADADDRRWYQTVYADERRPGSVAAPTAGLHFTPQLLARLAERGIERIDVTLHVGEGTFRPVTAERIDDHCMHAERFEVDESSLARLRAQRRAGRRVIAVGSTAARTLESLPDAAMANDTQTGATGPSGPIVDSTRLLIAPPYRFRHLDGMLTNFHLPRSTLLAMVAAMIGLQRLKSAYAEAIAEGYRFFSYGDAMLILPESDPTAGPAGAEAHR